MSRLLTCLALCILITSGVNASAPTPTTAGSGTSVSLPADGETSWRHCWTDSPDLEGMGVSSNVISELDMESHVANDFFLDFETTISHIRWWGVYWHYTPGDPHVTSFNLRIYDDIGCIPGDLLWELIVPHNANETFVYDYEGMPRYSYETCVLLALPPGLYWFEVQAGDSPFPPQWGRLAADTVQICDSVFKSAFYSYPDWVQVEGAFGFPFDASQEFTCHDPVQDTCERAEEYHCYLLAETRGFMEGNSQEASDDYNPTNNCTGNDASGGDIVYYMDLEQGDFIEMTYTLYQDDASLYLLTDCSDMESCVIGADANGLGEAEILTYAAPVADRYYLVLDARDRGRGGAWGLDYLVALASSAVGSPPPRPAHQLTVQPAAGSSFHIDFGAPLDQPSGIGIFDVAGRAVHDREVMGGASGIVWDGRDQSGHRVAPGVYFAQLRVGNAGCTTRLIVIR